MEAGTAPVSSAMQGGHEVRQHCSRGWRRIRPGQLRNKTDSVVAATWLRSVSQSSQALAVPQQRVDTLLRQPGM